MFLTLEDPRARIKGSRDPLGLQPIWSGFGRHLVTNLTTVTTSVRQFTVLMVGRWLAQELVEQGRIGEDDVLSVFLRFEQLAGYARHVVNGIEDDVRGIERIKRNLAESRRVTIQDNASGAILSDQKAYGIWGLYSLSARVSGLLDPSSIGVAPLTGEFLEETARPKIRSVEPELMRLLVHGGELVPSRNACVAAVAQALASDLSVIERDFYARILSDAAEVREPRLAPAARRQPRFARLLQDEQGLNEPIGREEMEAILARARQGDPDLAHPITRIVALEPLLAVTEEVFRLLQARNGQAVSTLGRELADHWGRRVSHLDPAAFRELRDEIALHAGAEGAVFASQAHDAFTAGDYDDAIRILIGWNEHVMRLRQGAPWIQIDSGGRLDCRFRAVEQPLPSGEELPTLWHNSYFIDSLKSVVRQVEQRP